MESISHMEQEKSGGSYQDEELTPFGYCNLKGYTHLLAASPQK
jgi:hypothetical protein